jgi:hypothetical protein
MGPRLEDLFGFVLENHAEMVQVFNRVEASKVDGKWVHTFVVTVSVEFGGKTERFRFEVERIAAGHELREEKKEDTPEYVSFQRSLLSMFHTVNTIERRLLLIKRTKLPGLAIEVQG